MLQVELINPGTTTTSLTAYTLSPMRPQHEGLVIHGYGSNKEEMLGLAVKISQELSARIVVFDLPGHGASQEPLNLKTSLIGLKEAAGQLNKVDFVIGHSLGAYLAMLSSYTVIAALSMPGEAVFDGNRKDQHRTLRTRRVHEVKPYDGLNEVLKESVNPPFKTLFLKAEQDLSSVNQLHEEQQNKGACTCVIKNTNHLDIISAPKTATIISDWLTGVL